MQHPPQQPEGPWAKLRQRKVVQWGIAYAAGAWGFLQGLAYLSTLLDWPAQLQKLTGLVLLFGLPVVVVLAWYHGDRGEQRFTRIELAILTVLFLIGGGLFWRYEQVNPISSKTARTTSPASAAHVEARPSIAVLPFANRSDKHEDVFFVDGIHDDILTQLTRIGAMKVIARTSVEQFRNTTLTTRQIGEKLGATTVLEGGVQRAGDRVRITVQLIDAATDGHLWAESYDRELTAANIFAIQSEVATAIAGALKATLTATEKATVSAIPTQNLQAWEAYQLGKQQLAHRTGTGLEAAEQSFQKAINLDPRFTLAHAGLAETLVIHADFDEGLRSARLSAADKAVETALQLDANLAEGWATSGLIAQQREQFDRAEKMFRRAIALNPNDASAYQWLGGLLWSLGRQEEGFSYMMRAAEVDPLSAIINLNVGSDLEAFGRFDEAEARYRKVIEIDPSMSVAYLLIGSLEAYARNRFAVAAPFLKKAVELDAERLLLRFWLATLYCDLGDDDEMARVTEAARARAPGSAPVLQETAVLAMLRGDAGVARQNAQKILALQPGDAFALGLLRDLDLQSDHYDLARRRYAAAYPALVAAGQSSESPRIDKDNFPVALDIALVLQKVGESRGAGILLDGAEAVIRSTPRMGTNGYGVADVQIHALHGNTTKALTALREAENVGWRGPFWRYYRDFDPALASIRNEPEFKAIFADIERDMARQRAELAKRPKDAPLILAPDR